MATRTKGFPLIRGNWKPIRLYEAASQTFGIGEQLQLASGGGQVSLAATAGNAFDSTSSKRWAGISMEAASGVTDAEIWVLVPADRSAEMCLPSDGVTAKNQVGDLVQLINISAAEGWAYDVGTSNGVFQINEIDPTYAVGETGGLLWGSPLDTASFIN